MGAKSKLKTYEERHGKPLAKLLVERLNTLHSVVAVAGEIPISTRYVSDAMKELGIEELPPQWRIRDEELEHAE